MTAMRSLLKVTGLSVRYGAIRALTSVSFEVAEGEIVTFVGANGAGKTTTLRALSGVLPAAEGKIEFLGRDITNTQSQLLFHLGWCSHPRGEWSFPT